MRRLTIIMAAAAGIAAASPLPVFAQDAALQNEDVGPTRDDGDNLPWGLLGLLGLAGLLPKKREPAIHVDARRGKP